MAQITTNALRAKWTGRVRWLSDVCRAQKGKASAKDIANLFKNHVLTDATLSDRDARLVSTDDFVGLISKVVAAGHGRTAAKVRSYLRAAYALAIRAKTNPAAPQSLRDFGIQVNPLASIDALAQYNRAARENSAPLSWPRSSSTCMPSRSIRCAMRSKSVSTWGANGPPSCCGYAAATWTSPQVRSRSTTRKAGGLSHARTCYPYLSARPTSSSVESPSWWVMSRCSAPTAVVRWIEARSPTS
jgi:hypothetical protein